MLEPPAVTFEPVLLGGAISWNADTGAEVDVRPVLSRWVYQDDSGNVADAAHTLATIWNTLGVPSLNSSPLFDVLMPQLHTISDLTAIDQAAVEDAIRSIDTCIDQLRSATPNGVDSALIIRELTHIAATARFAANELRTNPGSPAERRTQLDALIEEQRACWLLRARPGGLDRSLTNLEPLRAKLADDTVEVHA